MTDDERIRALVTRLARRDKGGGSVIERAAILAEGDDSRSMLEWIASHDGQPEALAPAPASGGLHGRRLSGGGEADGRAPRRYVLPPGVLS
jgi:hypothetical protein